ncbi:CACTA en-spm transposon protein [Cucumis melo var. makuwa]|uniref:CACTA en-spm transposon protein n=1 Tax=Cucumis melo var. makuwa TaxID=1194695 RepID=A0A5A7VML6_CUCMM|nr:CACTA en-spm transposon protein [Cucumis melo var. makuwa]
MKDVGIKNVGNKGFSDAVNNASGEASGKHSFPTHHEGVDKYSSEKGTETERGKRKEKPREPSPFSSPFCRCSAAVRRRPSPPSLAAVCHFSYGSLCSLEGFVGCEDFEDLLLNKTTPTPRRRAQSRLLELERNVAINGHIPMTIAPGAEKPISPHVVRFSQTIGVCVRKTFSVRCLKWVDVGREYIEVVKGDLQRLFVLDFNDQAMNRFVEHQMLTTFKEFRADYHRHFKKYSDLEEARANPPNALVGRDED